MKYIIYDLETTGLDHRKDQPIEIGVIITNDKTGEVEEYDIFVKTDQPLHPDIKRITGLDDEILGKKGVGVAEAMRAFFYILGSSQNSFDSEVKIIGHNIIGFDNLFLNRYAHEMGYQLPPSNNYFDTAGEFRGMLLGESRHPDENDHDYHARVLKMFMQGVKYNLTAACEHYKIDMPARAHRANIDCRYTLRVFEKQKGIELVKADLFNIKSNSDVDNAGQNTFNF